MDKLRNRIDELDAKLLKLLNERAECVQKIWKIKQRKNIEVFIPEREVKLLHRLSSLNKGPMSEDMVRHLFKEIIDTLKELQK